MEGNIMDRINFDNAISDAAKKLNEIYFMCGDKPNENFDLIERGIILGLSIAYNTAPQTIKASIDSFDE